MRPVHVVLLVLAGALGGAVVMRVVERPRAAAPVAAPVSAYFPASPSKPAAVPEAAPAAAPQAVPAAAEKPPIEVISDGAVPAPARQPAAPARQHVARTRSPRTELAAAPRAPSAPAKPPAALPAETAPDHDRPAPATENPAPPAPAESAAPAPAVAQPLPPVPPEPENATPPPPPRPTPNRVTLNAGMLISVRLVDGLSTERSAPGDSFTATLDRELVAGDFVIAERGARAEGRVVSVDRGSKARGGAALAVELTKVRTSDDQVVSLVTDPFTRHSEPDRSTDAAKVVGGAALGAILGAIAGGGKGAAIGAGAGGGAGAGDVMLTRKPATLASETRISFRLREPVTITEQLRP